MRSIFKRICAPLNLLEAVLCSALRRMGFNIKDCLLFPKVLIVKYIRLKCTEGIDAEILFTHNRQERQQISLHVVGVCYGITAACEVPLLREV